ncbi:MAG: hypothetical protein WCP03_00420 [Candidatus Saccharibacteria bacterium]
MNIFIEIILCLIPIIFFIFLFLLIYFHKFDKEKENIVENEDLGLQFKKYFSNIKIIWVLMIIFSIIAVIVANYITSKDASAGLGAGIESIIFSLYGIFIVYVFGFLVIAVDIFAVLKKLKKLINQYPVNKRAYSSIATKFSFPIKIHFIITTVLFVGFVGSYAPALIYFIYNGKSVASIKSKIDDKAITISYTDYATFKKDLTKSIIDKDINGLSRLYSSEVSKNEVAKSISGITLSTNQYTDFNNILDVNTYACSIDNIGNEYYGFSINDSSVEAEIVYNKSDKNYSIIPNDSKVMDRVASLESITDCPLDKL